MLHELICTHSHCHQMIKGCWGSPRNRDFSANPWRLENSYVLTGGAHKGELLLETWR